ncbi:hypothetical protein N7512_001159 [Penicillium capsulatum]|nr:hypothetical protein N7512_001159 [Penicillium capsulatum]
MSQVSAALAQYPDYKVTLVGHSLGGAVAALAGLEMQLKGWNPTVTTFGEPMVGNEPFAEYLDKRFRMGSGSLTDDPDNAPHHRFRRVTHVDDPVPLLPLAEWGYAPHAGEIFISQHSLPPSLGDVRSCVGSHDSRCIAGSDTSAVLKNIYQDVNIPLVALQPSFDSCSSRPRNIDIRLDRQMVLGEGERARKDPVACPNQDVTAPLYPLHWDWSLIPARYRLWELFYAHRDYFWRIGLCVPGGDPTR